jgi:hypothetical protein
LHAWKTSRQKQFIVAMQMARRKMFFEEDFQLMPAEGIDLDVANTEDINYRNNFNWLCHRCWRRKLYY